MALFGKKKNNKNNMKNVSLPEETKVSVEDLRKADVERIRKTDGSFSNFIAEGFYHSSLGQLTTLVERYQAELTPEERERIFEKPFVGPDNISYQFSIDDHNNVSIKEVSRINSSDLKEEPKAQQGSEKVDVSDLEMDGLRNSAKRVGQELAISKDHRTVSQSISLEKVGMHTPQTFSVTTHNENLLSVTQSGKMVASFQEKEDGTVQMTASKEFVEGINNAENLHLEGNVDENGNYVFDMTNLKLTKSGNLDTGEVRANNTAFAIMFSALGSQIRDAAGNRAMQTNTENPFDITVSTNFIKYAVQEKNGCTLEMEEPIFSALMVSRIHLARETFKSGKTAPVHLDLLKEFNSQEVVDPSKNVILHSIPIFRKGQDEKNPEYLNIMQRGGKSYLYVQTRNAQNHLTAPKFYEINNVSLQTTGENSGLYFGLKEKSQTSDILAELDFEKNNASLTELASILQNEFEATKSLSKVHQLKQKSPIKDVPLYNISSNRYNEIVSFGNVRELERTSVRQKDNINRQNLYHTEETPEVENEAQLERNNLVDKPDDDGEPASRVLNSEQTEEERQNFVPHVAPIQEESSQEEEQVQQPSQEEDEPRREENAQQRPMPNPKKAWHDLQIKPEDSAMGKTLMALFMISILVMIMIPIPLFTFWIPLAIGLGAIANLFHPINQIKTFINWTHHRKERKAEKQKLKQAYKAQHMERKQQKTDYKIYKINKRIEQKNNLIESYKKYKEEIEKNPKAFMKKHRGKNVEECIKDVTHDKTLLQQKIVEIKEKARQEKLKKDAKENKKTQKTQNKEKKKADKKIDKGLKPYVLPAEKKKSERRAGISRGSSRTAERDLSAGGRGK